MTIDQANGHPTEERSAPPVAILYRIYGKLIGERCGGCWHLWRDAETDTFQCDIWGFYARGPARPWLPDWTACGLWRANTSPQGDQ